MYGFTKALGAIALVALAPNEASAQRTPARPAANVLDCVGTIEDSSGGGCIQAASVPTSGHLFPYPGEANTFTPPAVVSGGNQNTAQGVFSTVGGGRFSDAVGPYSFVGGGFGNDASADHATISGGRANDVDGYGGAVGGGLYNSVTAFAATIGGGTDNFAWGAGSTVSGGRLNAAWADYSTASGGELNRAYGTFSFAAGRRANARHSGAFVWGDSSNSFTKESSAEDEFNVFAAGGTRMFSDSVGAVGVRLAPGAGTWTSVSDRDAKEHLEPVDCRAVLESVVAIPISTWSYKSQADAVRHMGPMAQDFHCAFGLGVDEKGIDNVDADGVALAAIQGLRQILAETQADAAEKAAELRRVQDDNVELRSRVERLESLGTRLFLLREGAGSVAERR